MRGATLPLVLLAALTFFVGLGRGAIADSDEAFYAEAAREMVESGDWITPYYNYEPRFQKPILYYWLTAATFEVTGPGEGASRLWAALAGLGLALATAACARRWYDDGTGLLAGAIVATSYGYIALGRVALPDLPLACLITLAIWGALEALLEQERSPRRWVLVSAAAVGLAFLTKGPLGFLIPAIVVLPIVMVERRLPRPRASDLIVGGAVFLAVAAPWYLVMFARHGVPYVQGFFIGDNFERFATDRFNDPRPFWFYLPVAAGGLLPWTPLALVWVGPVRRFLLRRRDIGTLDLRLLLWAAIPLIFFSVSVGKQPRYVLPILPPLAILLASSILERTRDWRSLDGARVRQGRDKAIVLGGVLAGLALAVVGLLVWRIRPLLLDVSPAMVLAATGTMVAAGLAVSAVAMSGAWRSTPAAIALASAVALPAMQLSTQTAAGYDAVHRMARLVSSARTAREQVASYQAFVRNLIFYTGVPQLDLSTEDQLVALLRSAERVLVVAPADVVDRIDREQRLGVRRLGELRYFNPASIRVGTLIDPDETRNLTRIVLVSNR